MKLLITNCAPAVLLVSAILAGSAPSRAADASGVVLVWSAPSHCPQEPAFRAQVEQFLKHSLGVRREQNIAIAATVREQAGGYGLVLQVGTLRGVQTRELSHSDCRELAEAGALVTALAIDPSLAVDGAELPAPPPPPALAAPPPAPSVEPPPSALPVAPARPTPAPKVSEEQLAPRRSSSQEARGGPAALQPSLVALVAAGNAALPGVGLGFGARLAAGPGPLRLALRGLYWLERTQPVVGRKGAEAVLRSWAVGARACLVPVSEQLGLWACLGADLGQLRGRGRELDQSRTARDRWSAVSAELMAVHTADSGLTTLLGFELGHALDTPRFGITTASGDAEVFQAPDWIAQASLGIGFSLGPSK